MILPTADLGSWSASDSVLLVLLLCLRDGSETKPEFTHSAELGRLARPPSGVFTAAAAALIQSKQPWETVFAFTGALSSAALVFSSLSASLPFFLFWFFSLSSGPTLGASKSHRSGGGQ